MYTVQKGDSLYKIAQKYNTTVQQIIDLNNLKTPNLSIGQILRIPETYTKEDDMILPEYINYVVQKGDNLYSIAKKNNITVETIMKDNNLTSNNLTIGQNLKIRLFNEIIEECFGEEYTPPNEINTINYTVKRGDNLYNIAKIYNTSVTVLMNLNNLTNTNLSIGQVLKIPTSSSPTNNEYIVKAGDNLYSIANRYNTTVSSIISMNNLKSNNLSIGQILKLPNGSSNFNQTYIVKIGDNLYSISQKFNTTVDNIKRKNNLTTNIISVGQILYI